MNPKSSSPRSRLFQKIISAAALAAAVGVLAACSQSLLTTQSSPESQPPSSISSASEAAPSDSGGTSEAAQSHPEVTSIPATAVPPEEVRAPEVIPADTKMTAHESEILALTQWQDGELVCYEEHGGSSNPLYFDGQNIIFTRSNGGRVYSIYKYSIETQKLKQIGETLTMGGYRAEASWNHIFMMTSLFENSGSNATCTLYRIDPFAGSIEEIERYSSPWLPELFVNQTGAFVNVHTLEGDQMRSMIDCYDAATGEYRTLCEETAVYNPDGTVTGQDIYIGGGEGDTLYYQVLTLDGIPVYEAKRTSIMALAFREQNAQPRLVYTSPYQLQYVNGLGNVVIINDYAYERPLEDTGKILLLDESGLAEPEAIVIEGIFTTNDIRRTAFVGEDSVYLATGDGVFSYSIREKTVKKFDVGNIVSSLISDGDNVYFCEFQSTVNPGEALPESTTYGLHVLPA